jgi:hypothetical protein
MAQTITEVSTVSNLDSELDVNRGGIGPLASLTGGNSGISNLTYPSDLANQGGGPNIKNHWVTFTIQDIQPATIGGATSDTLNQAEIKTSAAGTLGQIAAVAGLGAAAVQAVKGNYITAAATAAGSAVVGGLSTILKSGLSVAPLLTNTKSVISLYMPDTLHQSYDAHYEEMSLTADLGAAITTLRAIDQVAGNIGEGGLSGVFESMGNELSSDPALIQAAVSAMDVAGVSIPGVNTQNIATLLQRAQGFALNPQLQMIYRGTGLRTFQLTFTFTPKSKKEANDVNRIISQFRYYSSPSLQTGAVSTSSMFLIPPSVFTIEFYVGGKESPYLSKYGKCVLTGMDVNYAPNGFSVYNDGSMVQTQLNLSFKETDILTRDKFNSGERR